METKPLSQIEIHYQKANDFKTITSTGIIGGVTPMSQININFFSDRVLIPSKLVYKLDHVEGNGFMLGDIVDRESKAGSMREVQMGVLLDLNVAISVRDWLSSKIEEVQSQLQP